MSKKNPTAPAVDLANAMNFVATRNTAPPVAPAPASAAAPESTPTVVAEPTPVAAIEPTPSPTPATVPSPEPEPAVDSQSTTGKKESAPTESFDYAGVFLKPVRSRKTKAIYVDEDLHTALSTLTQAGGIGLADLLINIANHHFDTYRLAIRQFLNDQEKLKKKKLPY
ncbi:DUF3408 domain-containing protein [Hymenobacter psoromatis]|uniref:DUF3408 domain-containing protein n=2 Tax=Hymenobacter psoromatis TaxID=1484116 RepID=UPI001CBFAC17